MLYNEQFKADAIDAWDRQEGFCGAYPVFLVLYLNQKWLEMVRNN